MKYCALKSNQIGTDPDLFWKHKLRTVNNAYTRHLFRFTS